MDRIINRYFSPGVLAAAYIALIPVPSGIPGNLHLADLLFPLLVISVIRTHGSTWQLRPLDYCVVAYLVALLPSLAVTDDLRAGGFELIKRLYLAAVYVVFAIYFRAEGYVAAFRTVVYAALVVCAFGLAVTAWYLLTGASAPALSTPNPIPYIGNVQRLWLLMESPSMLANYLTFALPFLVAALFAGVLKAGVWAGALAAAAAVTILSFSHGLGGFVASGLATVWPLARGPRGYALRTAAAIASILLILGLNAMLLVTVRDVDWSADFDDSLPRSSGPYEFQQHVGAHRLNLRVSYNPMSYYLLKGVAWRAFLERPWAGFGLDRFHVLTAQAADDGRIHAHYRISDPHSTPFGALAETGIFGAVTIAALFVVAVFPLRWPDGSLARWFVVASQAAIIGLVVNSLNTDIMNFRFLWVGLAALRRQDV